jgi:hypothetical protein
MVERGTSKIRPQGQMNVPSYSQNGKIGILYGIPTF